MNGNTPDQAELKTKVHKIACVALGLDDEDHEDDEAAEPLEKAILALITQQPSSQSIPIAPNSSELDIADLEERLTLATSLHRYRGEYLADRTFDNETDELLCGQIIPMLKRELARHTESDEMGRNA